jgi:hypothetical protein
MARPSQVVEVPRFLLPGLTWNGTPLRATLIPRGVAGVPGTKQQRRQLSRSVQLRRDSKLVPSSTPLYPGRGPSTSYRSLSTSIPSNGREPFTGNSNNGTLTAPVRHNGIYVATFKPARRAFHASAVRSRDHHFDTLKFVQRLKNEGFSEEQAVATMRVLSDVIEESIQNLTRTMVLREGELWYPFCYWMIMEARELIKCV